LYNSFEIQYTVLPKQFLQFCVVHLCLVGTPRGLRFTLYDKCHHETLRELSRLPEANLYDVDNGYLTGKRQAGIVKPPKCKLVCNVLRIIEYASIKLCVK